MHKVRVAEISTKQPKKIRSIPYLSSLTDKDLTLRRSLCKLSHVALCPQPLATVLHVES